MESLLQPSPAASTVWAERKVGVMMDLNFFTLELACPRSDHSGRGYCC
jgi:hypothetical protein